jgi:peptidoglycan/LPS O-acetylase OafA/YrhL
MRSIGRRLLFAAASLLVLAIAWAALAGGVSNIPRSITLGQRIETAVQLVAGALSPLVVLTCFLLRRWTRPIRLAWAVTLAAAAGISALVWGPPMAGIALVFTAVVLLLTLGIAWALRAGLADPAAGAEAEPGGAGARGTGGGPPPGDGR